MFESIGSISGIVVATGAIVEFAKRVLRPVKYAQSVPVWVYSVIIAGILAVLANQVFKTSAGTPLLEGNIWQVIWSAVVAAAGASGFYTWFNNPQSPATAGNLGDTSTQVPASTTPIPPASFPKMILAAVILCPMFSIIGTGCTATGGFLGTGIGATSQPTSPQVTLANYETLFTAAVNGFVDLRKAGTITKGSAADKDFQAARASTYAALVNMRTSVAAGQSVADTDINAFTAGLSAIATAKSNGVNVSTTAP